MLFFLSNRTINFIVAFLYFIFISHVKIRSRSAMSAEPLLTLLRKWIIHNILTYKKLPPECAFSVSCSKEVKWTGVSRHGAIFCSMLASSVVKTIIRPSAHGGQMWILAPHSMSLIIAAYNRACPFMPLHGGGRTYFLFHCCHYKVIIREYFITNFNEWASTHKVITTV